MKSKKTYIVIDYQKTAGKPVVIHSFGIVEAKNDYEAKAKYAERIGKKSYEAATFTTIRPTDVGWVSIWDLKN